MILSGWCGYNWKSCMEGDRMIHPGQPWMWYSGNNVNVDKNGTMHLSIEERERKIKFWDGRIFHPKYAVGIVRSNESFDYGTFSLEMKMPKGKNLSASFWLTGASSWPPEIDIEEGWPEDGNWLHDRTKYFPWLFKSWRTTNNVVYLDSKADKKSKTHIGSRNILRMLQPLDPTENFIEYKCVWKPDSITFYANGKKVRKVTGKAVKKLIENNESTDHKMNVIINLWTEDPESGEIRMDSELQVRNFKYTPLEK